MALITCPECGKQVSDNATACPNCGFPVEERLNIYDYPFADDSPRKYTPEEIAAEDAKYKRNFIIIGLCALALFAFLTFNLLSPSKKPAKVFTGHTDYEAMAVAVDVVMGRLKAPSTAKFCTDSEAKISHDGLDYTIVGWVDAENSFSAMIRSTFIVTYTAVEDADSVRYKNAQCVIF